jgi:hypothetical protein
MKEDASTIVADAAWLAHRYRAPDDAVLFIPVSRTRHSEVTFLTDEYLGAAKKVVTFVRRDALAHLPAPAPLHFIFHSAFCCSTMLARALDVPGVVMALKEPMILNDLVGIRHRGVLSPPEFAVRLADVLRLLARPFGAGEAVVIKPSNVANALAPAMMKLNPDARALLLTAPLGIFLKSIVKKGLDGRLWVRDLLVKLITDNIIDLGFTPEDYLRLTDLQAAAVGWLAQHALFGRMAAQFGPARVITLDSETLMARPFDTVTALTAHFGLALSAAQVSEIVNGDAFTTHSKTGADFSAAERTAEYDAAANAHRDEIDKVEQWAAAVAANAGVSLKLPASLL